MSFTTRLDARLAIAGNPLPAEVSTYRTAVLSVATALEASTKLKAPMLAQLEDALLNPAEDFAKEYKP